MVGQNQNQVSILFVLFLHDRHVKLNGNKLEWLPQWLVTIDVSRRMQRHRHRKTSTAFSEVYVFAVLFAQAVYDHINDPDAGQQWLQVLTPFRQGVSLHDVDLRWSKNSIFSLLRRYFDFLSTESILQHQKSFKCMCLMIACAISSRTRIIHPTPSQACASVVVPQHWASSVCRSVTMRRSVPEMVSRNQKPL